MVGVSSNLSVTVFPGLDARLVRHLGERRENHDAYVSAGGYAQLGSAGTDLVAAVESSGLRGRGGAAFPTGVKLRSVQVREGVRYVVANGEEGEPASVKDRWLLRVRPHLVLDGLLRTARAVAADRAYVLVSDAAAAVSVGDAIGELNEESVPIELVSVVPAYVAGEETAVIQAIDGGPALPRDKPPRPFEAGVDGRPTVVANVETLANVPGIAVHGSDWFRAVGTDASPGTFLMTLSCPDAAPGLYEVPFGLTLHQVLHGLEIEVGQPSGVLFGGFFGGIVGPRAFDIVLDYDEVRRQGSGLGCGAVIVLGADDCPVAAVADVMAYFERENAKQCGACIRGTAAMRDTLLGLAHGTAVAADVERLRTWSTSLPGRGACALLDGAAALAGSLLREFPATVDEHLGTACARCAAQLQPGIPDETRFLLNYPDHIHERGAAR